MKNDDKQKVEELDLSLKRETFLLSLVKEITKSLQTVVGSEHAEGMISIVGTEIGRNIKKEYCKALNLSKIPKEQLSNVLIDLKSRINGSFYIIEENEKKIVLGNTSCPFGADIKGKPAACMMTANVFGHIASDTHGYARVNVEESIAKGHNGCRVVIYLEEGNDDSPGREFFRIDTEL